MSDPKPKAVLFDLDNTLIDRDRAMRCAVATWLERLGVADEVRRHALDEVMAYDAHGYRPRADFCRWMCTRFAFAQVSPEALGEQLRADLVRYVEPVPKVRALLQRIAQLYPIGLVSNGGSRTQRAKLQRAGLDDVFEPLVLVSGEVGAPKPSAAIFEMALNWLDLPPEMVLFVGDDLARDIGGAAAVGIRTCRVGRLRPLGSVDEVADWHIEHLAELGEVLGLPRLALHWGVPCAT